MNRIAMVVRGRKCLVGCALGGLLTWPRVTLVLALLVTACQSPPIMPPTQVLMVANPDGPSPSSNLGLGNLLKLYAFTANTNEVGWSEGLLQFPVNPVGAEPGIPPGIASDADIYVVVYWKAPGTPLATTRSLAVAITDSGRVDQLWQEVDPLPLATDGPLTADSRPALTFFPPRKSFFVAFRTGTGAIRITEFKVDRAAPAGSRLSRLRTVTTSFSTDRAPALGFVRDRLLLAFVPRRASDGLRMATSLDGVTFAGSFTATSTFADATFANSAVIDAGDNAPFLSNALGAPVLSVARQNRFQLSDVHALTTDGSILPPPGSAIPWNTQRAERHNIPLRPRDVTAAGDEETLVVALPEGATSATQVSFARSTASPTVSLATGTAKSVPMAFGPGPSVPPRRGACGSVDLVATGASSTPTRIDASATTTVVASGDVMLKCGGGPEMPARCPSDTRFVTVRRGTTDYVITCWRR